jgi:hypothetical protein
MMGGRPPSAFERNVPIDRTATANGAEEALVLVWPPPTTLLLNKDGDDSSHRWLDLTSDMARLLICTMNGSGSNTRSFQR